MNALKQDVFGQDMSELDCVGATRESHLPHQVSLICDFESNNLAILRLSFGWFLVVKWLRSSFRSLVSRLIGRCGCALFFVFIFWFMWCSDLPTHCFSAVFVSILYLRIFPLTRLGRSSTWFLCSCPNSPSGWYEALAGCCGCCDIG